MTRPIALLLRVTVGVLLLYLLATGAYGAILGSQIHKARAENAWLGIGTNIVGRNVLEGYVIKRLHVSEIITASPSFWIALQLTE